MKIKYVALAALAGLIAGSASAQVKEGAAGVLSNRDGSVAVSTFSPQPAGANPVCFPTNPVDSWDGLDDPDNVIVNLDIGAGNELSGVAFDVNISTIAPSWLSEATVQFSDSTGSSDPNAINLTPGVGNDAPGTMDFSSGGVVDFATIPLNNIVAGADGILRLQFFESFDDTADAVEATWSAPGATPAVCAGIRLVCTDQAACDAAVGGGGPGPITPVNVPTLSMSAMIAMAMLLMFGAVIVLRRQKQ